MNQLQTPQTGTTGLRGLLPFCQNRQKSVSFMILYFLASNRGQVFTKEQIYQAVWDRDYLLDDSNIMAFIRKLRKKIEPSSDSPKYILTIWGIGYKFSDSF